MAESELPLTFRGEIIGKAFVDEEGTIRAEIDVTTKMGSRLNSMLASDTLEHISIAPSFITEEPAKLPASEALRRY